MMERIATLRSHKIYISEHPLDKKTLAFEHLKERPSRNLNFPE